MQEFSHVIADPAGLHARPVASIASEALKWRSAATVTRDADAVAASPTSRRPPLRSGASSRFSLRAARR